LFDGKIGNLGAEEQIFPTNGRFFGVNGRWKKAEKVVFLKEVCSQKINCQMIPQTHARPLTNVQQEILKLYSTEFTEQELEDFRRELGKYFARKTTERADHVVQARGYTAEEIEQWLHE